MAYGDRNRGSSVFDGFTLSPLPYPVLMILALILIFLGVSWYFSYEEVVESAQVQLGWLLFATPVVLILIVRWLSSMENTEWFSGWDRRRRTTQGSSEGSSPWGVAALIVVLLILMQYQSIFRDNCVEGAFSSQPCKRSEQYVSPPPHPDTRSHLSSKHDTRNKPPRDRESKAEKSEASNDVTTDLELKTPGSSADQDLSSGKRKCSKPLRSEGSSLGRCSSSHSVQDSSSSSVDGSRKANE
ncbi:hypothetical protein HN873_042357 [Arachis hypogaea]